LTSRPDAVSSDYLLDVTLRSLAPETPPGMRHVPLYVHPDTYESCTHRKRHLDFYSLFIAEKGRGVHVIDSVPYSVSRGDVYVMGPGSEHMYADSENLLVWAIHFKRDVFEPDTWQRLSIMRGFDTLIVDRPASRRLHLDPAAYAEVASDLAALWSEWRSNTHSGALLVPALFLQLFVRLARFAEGEGTPPLQRPERKPHREEVVAAAVRTIDLHHGQDLRVEELAAHAYLSSRHFREIFASVMGRTPSDYIAHVRIERAKTLLATTALPISDIARTTGSKHLSGFTRRFRAATGITPREFRRSAQRPGEQAVVHHLESAARNT